jgi:hypothetical protein
LRRPSGVSLHGHTSGAEMKSNDIETICETVLVVVAIIAAVYWFTH